MPYGVPPEQWGLLFFNVLAFLAILTTSIVAGTVFGATCSVRLIGIE